MGRCRRLLLPGLHLEVDQEAREVWALRLVDCCPQTASDIDTSVERPGLCSLPVNLPLTRGRGTWKSGSRGAFPRVRWGSRS